MIDEQHRKEYRAQITKLLESHDTSYGGEHTWEEVRDFRIACILELLGHHAHIEELPYK